jgi:hypothetical protein
VIQREMPWHAQIPASQWVPGSVVSSWKSWREAVLWCWENRPDRHMSDAGDQATFRHFCAKYYGQKVYAPHVSRWVNPKTKAPMDLPPDLVEAFETFTGHRGLTQFFNRRAKCHVVEELQARMAA